MTIASFAQTPHTPQYLKNYTDSLIRRLPYDVKRIANTLDLYNYGKVSILSPQLTTSSTVGYVWTATNTSGAGAWTAGGSGHIIENSGTPLTARANLNFSNGLTAADNTPDTDAKLGGTVIENTNVLVQSTFALNIANSDGSTGFNVSSGASSAVSAMVLVHNIGGANSVSFSLDLSNAIGHGAGVIFRDNRASPRGIEYHGNYSSTLNSNSLTPKVYVDTKWSLVNGGTLTGPNTITSNARNQILFNGTWAAAATSDFYMKFSGSLTGSGTTTQTYVYQYFTPTLIYGANVQDWRIQYYEGVFDGTGRTGSIATGYDYNVTTTNILTHIAMRVRSGQTIFGGINMGATDTRFQIDGLGTGSGKTFQVGNSSGTSRFSVADNGVTSFVTIAPNGFAISPTFTTTGNNQLSMGMDGTITLRATTAESYFMSRINQTATTGATNQNLVGVELAPTFTANSTGVTVIGYDYVPTVNGSQTPTHMAMRLVSGGVVIGGTTLGTNHKLHIRGTGSTGGTALGIYDVADNLRVSILDNGTALFASIAVNPFTFNASYTTTASTQVGFAWTGTTTLRATSGDSYNLSRLSSTVITGATNQNIVGLQISPTYTINHTGVIAINLDLGGALGGSNTPTHMALRAPLGNILIGNTTITASTKMEVYGISTGTDVILALRTSAGTERMAVLANGVFRVTTTSASANAGQTFSTTFTAGGNSQRATYFTGNMVNTATSGHVLYNNYTDIQLQSGAINQVLIDNATFTAITTNHTGVTVIGWDYLPSFAGSQTPTHIAARLQTGAFLMGATLTAGSVLADFQSTTLGVLMPRVTNVAAVTTPVNSMVVYDAATNLFNFRQNGAWVTIGSAGTALSAITAATGTNTINNATYQQEWQWNTLDVGTATSGLVLSSNSTSVITGGINQGVLKVSLTGNQINVGTVAAVFSNTRTGANSSSIALRAVATGNGVGTTAGSFSASGATNNYAISIEAGDIAVPINTVTSFRDSGINTLLQLGSTVSGVDVGFLLRNSAGGISVMEAIGASANVPISIISKGTAPVTLVASGVVAQLGGLLYNVIQSVSTITTGLTLGSSQDIVNCNATSGSFTVTLPPAATSNLRQFVIKKIDASVNTVSIDPNASEQLEFSSSSMILTLQGQYISIYCDGTAWYIRAQ